MAACRWVRCVSRQSLIATSPPLLLLLLHGQLLGLLGLGVLLIQLGGLLGGFVPWRGMLV